MKCALCNNTDNLLIQVQAGSGLSLHLCPEHENTPLFEVAARLAAENEKLRRALEKIAEGKYIHEYLVMIARKALEAK